MLSKVLSFSMEKLRSDLPILEIGDNVEVSCKFKTKEKEKILKFEGMIISKKNQNNINYSFTVIKEYNKFVVSNLYFYNSPSLLNIKKIEKTSKLKFRRAKLYYLREKIDKKKEK